MMEIQLHKFYVDEKKDEEGKGNKEKEVSEAEDEPQVQIPPPTSTPEVPELEVIQID